LLYLFIHKEPDIMHIEEIAKITDRQQLADLMLQTQAELDEAKAKLSQAKRNGAVGQFMHKAQFLQLEDRVRLLGRTIQAINVRFATLPRAQNRTFNFNSAFFSTARELLTLEVFDMIYQATKKKEINHA
jgi:hypothetical protein